MNDEDFGYTPELAETKEQQITSLQATVERQQEEIGRFGSLHKQDRQLIFELEAETATSKAKGITLIQENWILSEQIAALIKEQDELRQHRDELKGYLDAVAEALHPGKSGEDRWAYEPGRLAGMVRREREERDETVWNLRERGERDAQIAFLLSIGKPLVDAWQNRLCHGQGTEATLTVNLSFEHLRSMAEALADLPAAGRELLDRLERAETMQKETLQHCMKLNKQEADLEDLLAPIWDKYPASDGDDLAHTVKWIITELELWHDLAATPHDAQTRCIEAIKHVEEERDRLKPLADLVPTLIELLKSYKSDGKPQRKAKIDLLTRAEAAPKGPQ